MKNIFARARVNVLIVTLCIVFCSTSWAQLGAGGRNAPRVSARDAEIIRSRGQESPYEQPPTWRGEYPEGCEVVGTNGAANAVMVCMTQKAMNAYGKYCCQSRGKFEFQTDAKWLALQKSAEKKSFVIPSPADIRSGDEAFQMSSKIVRNTGNYRAALKILERGAELQEFSCMIEIANLYNYHWNDLGVSKEFASTMVTSWIDKARRNAAATNNRGAQNYLREFWPLPGQTTKAQRFNQLTQGTVDAIRSEDEYSRCAKDIQQRYDRDPEALERMIQEQCRK